MVPDRGVTEREEARELELATGCPADVAGRPLAPLLPSGREAAGSLLLLRLGTEEEGAAARRAPELAVGTDEAGLAARPRLVVREEVEGARAVEERGGGGGVPTRTACRPRAVLSSATCFVRADTFASSASFDARRDAISSPAAPPAPPALLTSSKAARRRFISAREAERSASSASSDVLRAVPPDAASAAAATTDRPPARKPGAPIGRPASVRNATISRLSLFARRIMPGRVGASSRTSGRG